MIVRYKNCFLKQKSEVKCGGVGEGVAEIESESSKWLALALALAVSERSAIEDIIQ